MSENCILVRKSRRKASVGNLGIDDGMGPTANITIEL
jgi:hypothetical protein